MPKLRNRSKSDPCSYEHFCLESLILSFPKVMQIPPESLCIYDEKRSHFILSTKMACKVICFLRTRNGWNKLQLRCWAADIFRDSHSAYSDQVHAILCGLKGPTTGEVLLSTVKKITVDSFEMCWEKQTSVTSDDDGNVHCCISGREGRIC